MILTVALVGLTEIMLLQFRTPWHGRHPSAAKSPAAQAIPVEVGSIVRSPIEWYLTYRAPETIMTRNGLLPRLDLFTSLGETGYADTFFESFKNLDDKTRDYTVGIRLRHYLGNRAAKDRNLAAYAGRQQASEAVANLKQLVHLDVRLVANLAELIRHQIDATHATPRSRP